METPRARGAPRTALPGHDDPKKKNVPLLIMGRAAFAALIPGYGVPRDLFKDVNYRAYLSLCFNALFEKYQDARGTIVLSGGATDCFRPYRRTEAHEMRRWFQHQKALTEKIIKKELRWKLVEDRKALP